MRASRTLHVRPESAGDAASIRDVVHDAFGGTDEADLVELLRDRGQALVSLVAEENGAIVGHVMVSPISITGADGPFGGVAPLSVASARQRRGIGSALMSAAIEESRALGLKALFLVGNPAYYRRFGFTTSHLGNEYGATDAFMHLELEPRALLNTAGTAHYVNAFAEAGA